jgi:hypothetical protein
MIEVLNLEIHAWHGCNLSCESCSHYSSLGLKGGPTADECAGWMRKWSGRLRPRFFSIVGGEPTLNRDLSRIVRASGQIWPHSIIRVVTNGFLLSRHRDLPQALSEIGGRAVLDVSSHHSGKDFQDRFAKVRALVREWTAEFGINVRIFESDKRWTRRYSVQEGGGIAFGDGDPRLAWENCEGKRCTQLFDGKLWKCPPIAYFELLSRRVKLDQSWRTLAQGYRSLDPGCTGFDLASFVAEEEEEICRLCPSKLERFDLPNPIRSTKAGKPSLTGEL